MAEYSKLVYVICSGMNLEKWKKLVDPMVEHFCSGITMGALMLLVLPKEKQKEQMKVKAK